MVTLEDFLQMAMGESYKVNVFYLNTGEEITHQLSVGDTIEYLQGDDDLLDLLFHEVISWDINEEKEFTINIE